MSAELLSDVERIDRLFRSVLGRFFSIPARQPASGGVTFAQMRVLWVLEQRGPSCPADVARILGVSRPTVTELSDRLVGEGMVRRDASPSDRRHVILSLRPRGRALLAQFARGRQERFRKLLGAIGRADAARLVSALENLNAIVSQWKGG